MIHHVPTRRAVIVCILLLLVPLALVSFPTFLHGSSIVHSTITSPLLQGSKMSPLHPQVTRRGGVYLQPGGDTNPGPRAGTPPGCKWSTDPVTAFKVLWPSLESQLTDKYSKDTYSILCLDRWASTWTNLNCTQSMQDIFKALGWPSDLLKNSTYVECVGPLTADELKALTTPFPETTTVPKASTIANNCVWDLGDWVVVHPIIHICDFVTQLLQGVLAQPLGGAFQLISEKTGTYLWITT